MSVHPVRVAVLFGAALSLSGLTVPQAQAQEGEAPAADDSEVAAPAASQEEDVILVTARRRQENLQDVPVSVTALTSDAIEQQGLITVRELATQIPGLTFQESFGRRDDRPGIRGLTSIGDPSFGVESGVAIFVDGVFVAADTSAFGLHDLERVEVVRGPQSALYGRNSYAGAINFVTRDPGDELQTTASALYGRYDESEFTLSASGAIIPGKLKAGFYARHYSYDGEYTNPFNGRLVGDEETNSISGTVVFEPAPWARVRVRAAYSEDDDGHIPFTMAGANTDFEGDGIAPFDGDDYFVGELPGATGDFTGPLNEDLLFVSGLERQTFIGTLRADFDIFDGHTFSILAGYQDEERLTGSDSAPLGTTFGGFSLFPFDEQTLTDYSVEVRLESPQDQRLRWVGGFFFYEDERENFGVSYQNLAPFTPVARPPSIADGLALNGTADPGALNGGISLRETTNWAVFGGVDFDITAGLTATAEVRYAEDEKRVAGFDVLDPSETFPAENVFEALTPRFILSYQPTDAALFYGSVARGNKPGGFNNRANRDTIPITVPISGERIPFFNEEIAWTYEVGTKTSWLDGRINANLSFYYSDVEDVQLTQTYSWVTGFPDFEFLAGANIVNIPEVEVFGLELETRFQLHEYADLTVGYAWVDSEIQAGQSVDHGRLFPDFDGVGPEASIAGLKFPRISEHQVNGALNITYPTRFGSVFLNVNGSYESERFVQVSNLAIIPSATIVNARAGFILDEARGIELAVFGRNIFDEDSPVDALRFRDGDFRRAFQVPNRKGATFGGELIYRY